MEMHRYIATCPEATKGVLAQELKDLGAHEIAPGYMSVQFSAPDPELYRIHLRCATASQIMRILRESAARDPQMLFSQARRVDWTSVFSTAQSYRVDAIAGDRGEGAMTSNEISKAIRLAIEDVFRFRLGQLPKVEIKEPDVVVIGYVHRGRVTISVLTSGMSLHKRGYRLEGHPAPLKETLAASILRLSGYDGSQAFLDPMCGSGTLAIEAAMMALGKGCNIHRKKGIFSFENLQSFDKDLWRSIQDEIRLEKLESPKAPVFASDIDASYVDLAQKNALRARVEKFMTFETRSFFDLEKPADQGILVTNLPYGERIRVSNQELEMGDFYNALGDKLKKSFSGWRAALLVANETPWKALRLKPTENYQLLNGSIETRLLVFELRSGSYHS
jgi:putative N6-adenine-specific DNA methylase